MPLLWVERVATVDDPFAPWRPDVPLWMDYSLVYGIPTDKVHRPLLQTPLTEHLLVSVSAKDKDNVKNPVPPDQVSASDRLFVQMMDECGIEYDRRALEFFASIPNLGNGDDALKEIAARLLEQACARDLSQVLAETIRAQYDLPQLTASMT